MSKRNLKDNSDLTVNILGQQHLTFRKKNPQDQVCGNLNDTISGQTSMPLIKTSTSKGLKQSFSKADPLEQILMIQQNSHHHSKHNLLKKSQNKSQQKLSLPRIKQNVQFLGKPSSQLGGNSEIKGRNSLMSAMVMKHSHSQDRIQNIPKRNEGHSAFNISTMEQSQSLTASQLGFQVAPLKVKNFQSLQQNTQNTSQQTTFRTRIPLKTLKKKGHLQNLTPSQANPTNDSLNDNSRFSKLNDALFGGPQPPSLTPSIIHYKQFMIPSFNDPSNTALNQWQNDSILIQNSEKINMDNNQKASNNQRYSNFDATFNNKNQISVKLRESNLSKMVKRATQREKYQSPQQQIE